MQTFLPYQSFKKSAESLDMKRLGKQRVEAYQILQCLTGERDGWKNHPAVRMWKGHELYLVLYAFSMCEAWKKRGYKDTIQDRLYGYAIAFLNDNLPFKAPDWLGNREFHRSHRSNLLRKKPEHYGRFGWKVPDTLPYVWPA